MKALVYLGPGRMELRDVPEPEGKDSVVVKVKEAGICGTDIKTFLRGHHLFKPPTVLGHECYGVVVKKPAFIKNIDIGDWVAVAPYGECGTCEKCRKGLPELCERKTYITSGCFAQFVEVPPEHMLRGLFKINSPGRHIVFAEPLACVLCALRKVAEAETFLIVGGGVMGSLFAAFLKSRGAEVKIVEVSKWRLSFLADMGFEVARPEEVGKGKAFDAIIVASTIEDPLAYSEVAKDGGTVMLFGGYPKGQKLPMDPYHVHYREVRVVGSFGYGLKDFAQALEEIENHRELYAALVTHTYKMEDYRKAFERAISKDCMKVSIRMWEGEEE